MSNLSLAFDPTESSEVEGISAFNARRLLAASSKQMALGHLAVGQYDMAAASFKVAAEAGELESMHRFGNICRQQGRFDEAEYWLRRAASGGRVTALVSLGILAAQTGEDEEAEAWFTEAADRPNALAMYNLGWFLQERGRNDEAARWYKATDFAYPTPETNGVDLANVKRDAQMKLGYMAMATEDWATAAQWFGKAGDAGHVPAMWNCGVLARQQGNRELAIKWLNKARAAGWPGAAEAVFDLMFNK